jgi:hypothetical protein
LWWGFLRLEFELRTSQLLDKCSYSLSHSANIFCVGHFWDRVSQTILPGLIMNCARITDVSHWHLVNVSWFI